MKTYLRFLSLLLIAVVFSTGAAMRNVKQEDAPRTGYFTFVVIETAISRKGVEIDEDNPEENRFYVSNVIEFPDNPQLKRKAKEIADAYFQKTVVEPMKAKGFNVEYYEQDVQIDGGAVYTPATRAEAEEMRKKALEDDLQGRGANIFTFTWAYGKEPKGLETAAPKLFYRDSGEPLYGE